MGIDTRVGKEESGGVRVMGHGSRGGEALGICETIEVYKVLITRWVKVSKGHRWACVDDEAVLGRCCLHVGHVTR